ncbi:hypothetical protein HHK36_020449 [Tetracentron sinense]|uniref:Embryo sac development arrest 6 n=1 Tax=Tetracentron sinense TaxID=13715 RepID=A0A834YTW6_TETSI|nr:hypothetical protein HHK36_020449 [Tetracentron sinense]
MSRRVLTPGASRKRKEREAFDTLTATSKAVEPASSNRLLAGYLAHEFLSQGTLFGQRWDPAQAEVAPVSAEPKKANSSQTSKAEQSTKQQSYMEVASLLKMDGANIPGIVNPTHLFRWLQM